MTAPKRCSICGRVLLRPAAVTAGGSAIGPKCARRAGMLKPSARSLRARAVRHVPDTRTIDMFGAAP